MAPNTHPKQPRSSRRFSRLALLALLLAAFALVASSCGRDDTADPGATTTTAASGGGGTDGTDGNGSETVTVTTEPPPPDITTLPADFCDNAPERESSEIGVSKDKITLLVMADVGSTLAPGLFQGSIDGAKAWAEHVNKNGGLACRQIELIEHDSKISSVDTTNGFLKACEEALAMVGSTALFATDIRALNSCDDQAGNPTGIPDIAERAVEAAHSCSPNAFAPTNGVCPFTEGAREYRNNLGPHKLLAEQAESNGNPLHGIFLIPGDLSSATNSSMPGIRAHAEFGVANDGEFNVSGGFTQAQYGTYITAMKSANSNYAYNGSNDQTMLLWKSEAQAQGLELDSVTWMCSIACYTPTFLDNDVAEGTYVWMPFLPFEERTHNAELDTFLTAMETDNPASWSAGAWVAGRMLENAVNTIVLRDGVNGITRAKILAEMRNLRTFTANGWFGTLDWSTKLTSKCYVLLQAQEVDDELAFVRIAPSAPGTLDCSDDNIIVNYLDSAKEASSGPEGYDSRKAGYKTEAEDDRKAAIAELG